MNGNGTYVEARYTGSKSDKCNFININLRQTVLVNITDYWQNSRDVAYPALKRYLDSGPYFEAEALWRLPLTSEDR